MTTAFFVGALAHRTVAGWRALSQTQGTKHGKTCSWQGTAKAYARTWGESKILLADGRVLRYWREENRIRQRTYAHVILQ